MSMSLNKSWIQKTVILFILFALTGCFQPPHNNFEPEKPRIAGVYKTSKKKLIKQLQKHDIQYVQYGDTHTLIVPTDKYYRINSPRIHNLCYKGMFNIIRLLKNYSCHTIYIAAFTDDIGSDKHKKKLTQARAETMLTYLWAHGIPAKLLKAEGYSDKHPVSNNKIIHGSAQNRRLEIQWYCQTKEKQFAFLGRTK